MWIREATMADASGIAKVHVDSWRTTYKGIVPDEYLSNLSYEQRKDLWQKNIGRKNNYVLVAENSEEQIVGFADAWKRENNFEQNSIDLTSIYLLDSYQGKGVGKKLLGMLFQYFNQENYNKVFVEVLEENNTRFFYEYYGACLVETIQIEVGGKTLNESIYVWKDVKEVLEQIRT
ncbi:GNAT family N-acetyltransferase [Salinicoccus sesuvii]|uniref:GNAT family N-acetyltransferase n=1 Tax=Salinicoccus sesuvii TaxID=868281 RepID=A0ABV7N472_9STAP